VNYRLDGVVLRRPEARDAEDLYRQKNDPAVANLLGGFSVGYSHADMLDWIDRHRAAANEVIWVIADPQTDCCLGHVGLYRIDHRIGSAEFGIMIGDKDAWGKGFGKLVTTFTIRYGFDMLNLNRIELTVLCGNDRARRMYEELGFVVEGIMRQAQYKDGRYHDVAMMSMLRAEFVRPKA